MWAWIRTPRGSTTTALVVVVILALLWFDPWTRPFTGGLPISDKIAPTAGPQASLTSNPAPANGPAPVGNPGPANGSASKADATAPTAAAVGSLGNETQTSGASAPSTASRNGSPASGSLAGPAHSGSAPSGGTQQTNGVMASAGQPRSSTASEPGAQAGADKAAVPGFDIVRVEPDGSTVVAGRGEPGSEVVLLDGDKAVARAQVDASGQFALLPPTLEAGDHTLALQTSRGDHAPVRSAQSLAVSVAKQAGTRPLVALLSPDKPAEILSDGGAGISGAGRPGAATQIPAPVPLAIQAVEAKQAGQFTATGVARPGSSNRVYLNGSFVAEVTAGSNGRWSVEVQKGMTPGRYQVRADQVEPTSGKVVTRVEVPFDYPAANGTDGKPSHVAQAGGEAASLRDATARAGTKSQSASTTGAVSTAGRPNARPLLAIATPSPAGGPAAQNGAPGQRPVTSTGTAPAQSGSGLASTAAPGTGDAPQGSASAIVPDLKTKTVSRGESLWRISRKLLGRGVRYTEIYASNAAQIRDPALIYPGQVFVMPTQRVN